MSNQRDPDPADPDPADPDRAGPDTTGPDTTGPDTTEPMSAPIDRIALAGVVVWTAALVATLVIPSLHAGDRSWWPWAAVAGVVIGLLGWGYLRRGRGNAAAP